MSAPEHFVSRWMRLKGSSEFRRSAGDTPRSSAREMPAAGPAVAQPEVAAAASARFDPASLPPIEAIGIDTDISAFLQSQMPAALARDALRRAWTSDPAIRDFIGIAENQWDFNDPNAISGFGPLPEGHDVRALLSQALGRRDEPAELIPEMPASVDQLRLAATDHGPAAADHDAHRDLQASQPTGNPLGLRSGQAGEDATPGNDRVDAVDDSPRSHRSHGSALPR
jgi:Protein of unknown function (DUF3306)